MSIVGVTNFILAGMETHSTPGGKSLLVSLCLVRAGTVEALSLILLNSHDMPIISPSKYLGFCKSCQLWPERHLLQWAAVPTDSQWSKWSQWLLHAQPSRQPQSPTVRLRELHRRQFKDSKNLKKGSSVLGSSLLGTTWPQHSWTPAAVPGEQD